MKPVLHISDIEWAYAAGFLDGEGHIRITRHSARERTFMLQVSAVQSVSPPIDWLKKTFGGTSSFRTVGYNGEARPVYTWQTSSKAAETFLRGVLPYLIVKKDEALIALEFRKTFRSQHVKGGHKKMTDGEIQYRAELAESLKRVRKEKRSLHA